MKLLTRPLTIIYLVAIMCACTSSPTQQEREATYVKDGDTINPLEGKGEGTVGNKYMESADNSDSTKNIQQDLELN